ncbi:MAG: hypothetical protein KDD36_00985 [Flavobacteriales bacterium]|nr:hypothetical protein [Flavobacteriales bacterium]
MRRLVYIIFIAGILNSFGAHGQSNADTSEVRANELLEKLAFYPLTLDEKNELRHITFYIQNKGFLLEEQHRKYRAALNYIDKALYIWHAVKDTLSEANLRKYRGLLLGQLERYNEGKHEIHIAENLYGLVGFTDGLAVCHFDLAKVYGLEGRYDSACFYAQMAMDHWDAKKDTFRIVTVRNLMIHLNLSNNDLQAAAELVRITEPFLVYRGLHWLPMIDFYFLGYEVHKLMNSGDLADKYHTLYYDRLVWLKQKEIEARSTYAPDS